MDWHLDLRPVGALAAFTCILILSSGCGGGGAVGSGGSNADPLSGPMNTGTGVLRIAVTDPEGRPLADARVTVYNERQTKSLGSARTGAQGTATVNSLPAKVRVSVFHDFGFDSVNNVGVAQSGGTTLSVTVQARRLRPTVALLPIEIPPTSVTADRSALTIQVALVASPGAPFNGSGYSDHSATATPSLGLALGDDADDTRLDCYVWLDQRRTIPDCGTGYGASPYEVTVEQFRYEANGSATPPASSPPARSAMLVLDQSRRVATLDPGAFRSFAARRFIERMLGSTAPANLAIAGFSGDSGDLVTPSMLPTRPLYAPLGSAAPFTIDAGLLKSSVQILEPLLGGSADLLRSVEATVSLTAAAAPPGSRTVVMLLGGGDDGDTATTTRGQALAALRQQRDDTGVRSILVDGAPWLAHDEHRRIADLAAALRAATISFGVTTDERDHYWQSWASGTDAALNLAADLVEDKPLPTLSASLRMKAHPGAFASGAFLRGILYVESDICPMGCWEIPVAFSVLIP